MRYNAAPRPQTSHASDAGGPPCAPWGGQVPARRRMCPVPLVLLPRKAVDAPAVAGIAVMLVVELAFEAVEHIHHVLEAGAFERFARFERAVAAAADEHHGPVVEVRAGGLLHLVHEMGIDLPFGAVVPRNRH